MREAIPIDKKLALEVHRLRFRDHVSKSENYLGLALPSTSKCTLDVCKVLVTHFYKECI